MSESLIGYVYFALPFIATALITCAVVAYAGISLESPRFLVYPFLCILFFVSENQYGSFDEGAVASLYSRGTGILYFPLLNWMMLAGVLWAKVGATLSGYRSPPSNLYKWFCGWIVLLAAHFLTAVFLDVDSGDALSSRGFSNIIWMVFMMIFVLLAFQTSAQTEELTRFVLVCGLARALFGLVRWVAFGGDPANIYGNFNGVDIKLTFFDNADNLLCTMAFSIAALRLFRAGANRVSNTWRFIDWITLISTAACVILSYRRAAWTGFLIAASLVLAQIPRRRRILICLAMAPVVFTSVAYAAFQRLSQTKGAGSLGDFFYDVSPTQSGTESPRVLELKLAWADFVSHPLSGIGAWGRYTGHELISWQTGQLAGSFVHGGLVHIAFKSGLIGLLLFGGTIAAFVLFARSALKAMPDKQFALGMAGIAGAAFMLPDFVISTPIVYVRTMHLIALCLALPYLVCGLGSSQHSRVPLSAVPRAVPRST